MASSTEPAIISDVVSWESNPNFTRAEHTVLSGETVNVGDLCYLNAASKMVKITTDTSEVQTIATTGTPGAGTYNITATSSLGSKVTTSPLAYGANATTIAAALNEAAVLGTSAVGVSGDLDSGIVITFSGTAYKGIVQPLVDIDLDGVTGIEDWGIARTTEALGGAIDGVAIQNIGLTTADTTCLFLVRGPATVKDDGLSYGTTTVSDVDDALAALDIQVQSNPAY